MTLMIGLIVRSTLLLACGLLAARLLRRRSAAVRHLVLGAALAGAAVVGPLSVIGPRWELSLAVNGGPPAPPAAPVVTATVRAQPGARQSLAVRPGARAAAALWGLGALAMLVPLALGHRRLRRVERSARPLPADESWARLAADLAPAFAVRRPVALLETSSSAWLGTWGTRRPRILIPADACGWSEGRIRAVLCHELAHVRRCDWLVQRAAEVVRALFWFNPLAWMVAGRLRDESERACDDLVLRSGIRAADYAAQLSDLARLARAAGAPPAGAMAMARPSSLPGRIAAMLNPSLDRQPPSPAVIAWTAAAVLTLTASVAAIRTTQDAPMPLSGAVYDPTGAAIPDVAITLASPGRAALKTTTDRAGRFTFPDIAPGEYELQASLAGFRTLKYELTLNHARDWNQAITLQVGQVTETISVDASRAPASSPPAAGGPTRIRVGGNVRPPLKVKDVHPRYPDAMRAAGEEGVVAMEAVIGRDGSVTSVRVLSGHVHPDLALAAVDAVRQWRFQPTLLNGEPVEVAMTVTVAFTLHD